MNKSKLIEDFEEAVRAHEMMGAVMPEQHEAIELRYRYTKDRLEKALTIIKSGKAYVAISQKNLERVVKRQK
jgi:hypothetical protein